MPTGTPSPSTVPQVGQSSRLPRPAPRHRMALAPALTPAQWCRTWTSDLLPALWCVAMAGGWGGGWLRGAGPAQRCRTWTSNLLSALWCAAMAGGWGGGWLRGAGPAQRCRTWTSNLLSALWCAAMADRATAPRVAAGRSPCAVVSDVDVQPTLISMGHRPRATCRSPLRGSFGAPCSGPDAVAPLPHPAPPRVVRQTSALAPAPTPAQWCPTWTSNLLSSLWATAPRGPAGRPYGSCGRAPGVVAAGCAWPRQVGPAEAPKVSPGGPIGAARVAERPRPVNRASPSRQRGWEPRGTGPSRGGRGGAPRR